MSSSSLSLWTHNNINELSQSTLLSWWMRRKRRRRQPARNTFISTLQNVFSPSKIGLFCLLCFFLTTGVVDGSRFLNNGWTNAWFHFFTRTPSGDQEWVVSAPTGFETTTNPESQVWPHWIRVGNAGLLGLCMPVKIPKGLDARKMPSFVRKDISHTAAGLASLEPHVKNKAKWRVIWASVPDDRIHELSSLWAFLEQTESTEPKPAWWLCLTVVLFSAKLLPCRGN